MTFRQKVKRRLFPAGALSDPAPLRPISRVFGFDRGQPIDRYYIESFLHRHRHLILGDVLEVAGSEYTRRFGQASIHACELHLTADGRPGVLAGDLTRCETLPAARFDCFICTQTFNFIYDVRAAIRGSSHLLASGGHLLATVGGVSQVSRYDLERWGDYWRFTAGACERLFAEDFAEVSVIPYGNLTAAVAMLRGFAVEDLPEPALLDAQDADYPVTLGIMARKA